MTKYGLLKRDYLGKCCRECMNQQCSIQLQREDCSYLPYAYECKNCGEIKHIVTGLAPAKRMKLNLMRN